jgi:hypothetical protein
MVDATTQGALEATVLYWRMLLWADFDGDPLRATSGLYDRTISGSGDAELDGFYDSYDHNLISVGPVKHNETGSDTVTVTMSGLLLNADLLNMIGDRTKWQGRSARLWFYCADENETQVGSIIPYYTGYMNDVVIAGSPSEQRITLTIENYLATLSGAPSQTYMMQNLFDAGDLSANATLGAANGIGSGSGVSSAVGGGASIWTDRMNTQVR